MEKRNNMILAIDFSINSPGLSFLKDGKLKFASLTKKGVCPQDFYQTLEEHQVRTIMMEKYKKVKNNSLDSRGFTLDAIATANGIIELIEKIYPNTKKSKDNILIIEGFSFGSKGNRLAQTAGYQYILRYLLIERFFPIENLYLYPPQTIKSKAGAAKRGEGKKGMIERFIEHDKQIGNLSDTVFYQEMKKDEDSSFRAKGNKRKPVGNWRKPIDDIVDSYWILYTYFIVNEIPIP